MPALTAKETARYGVRLFGYLLASTLLAGVVAAAGFGLAYVLDPTVEPGGKAPGTPARLIVGAFGLVALVVLVAGLFVVAFAAVTNAVRLGIEGSDGQSVGDSAGTTADDRSREERSTGGSGDEPTRTAADDAVAGGDPTEGGSGEAPEGDPFNPTDPVEDPHSASSDPLAGPAEPDGDDEAWREEIEAKFDDDQP